MRIGIDGATWANARGYGRFTRELVRALARLDNGHSYSLFLDQFTSREGVPPGIEVITVGTRVSPAHAASADSYRSPSDILAFSRTLAATSLDLIFFPSVYTYVPVLRRRPVVVAIHDVIAERFPRFVFKNTRARLFWNLKTRLAIWQATRVLTVSEHSKRGIQDHFRLGPGKIRVTNEAPSDAFCPIRDREAIGAAYHRIGLTPGSRVVMYLGGISPHKNLHMLVSVFAELIKDDRFADVKLLITGDCSGDVFYSAYPSLRDQVEATCGSAVVFSGYLDDDTVALLLNGAQVCVLPSLDEGFGLPGIEAAACGTPLICTRSSALPELLGDAAIYIDPAKPLELRVALARVLQDELMRRRMAERGVPRAQSLTWEAAAQTVVQVFEELASGGHENRMPLLSPKVKA